MYWFRTDSLQFLLWVGVAAMWGTGGWLAAASIFKLEKGENLLTGFGLGLAGYLWFANLLGHFVGPDVTFTGAGVVVFLFGVGAALNAVRKNGMRWVVEQFDIVQAGPLLAATVFLTWIFLRISEGVGMFDEFTHLPLISTLAAGDIPPRFFVNSTLPFAYHYGFHLLGASLMRLGGMFPGSVFDLSKSILWGYAVVLAWMVGQRLGRKPWGGWLAALTLVFASGTRYLLLLAPRGFLDAANPLIIFDGAEAGASFAKRMINFWGADGAPPIGFPFAFMSGITEPLAIAHAGLHILHIVLILLIWFLAGRIVQRGAATAAFTVLYSLWALTWETSYALFMIGGFLAAIVLIWAKWREVRQNPTNLSFKQIISSLPPAVYAIFLSAPIVLLQGGLLTEIARGLLAPAAEAAATSGFIFRWPPVILSKHLGAMNIFSPITLLIAVCEIGPVLFFLPWVTRWGWRKFKTGEWIWGALILSAWVGFLIPMWVGHRVSSDLSRVSAHAMLVFLLFFALMLAEQAWSPRIQTLAGVSLAVMMVGGGFLLSVALTASSRPMLAYRFDELDAMVAIDAWDKLPPDAEVFDPGGWHGIALTGRLSHSRIGDYFVGVEENPAWVQLGKNPTIDGILTEGYSFVFFNETWWKNISEAARHEMETQCIVIVSEHWSAEKDRFRKLLDLRGCIQ